MHVEFMGLTLMSIARSRQAQCFESGPQSPAAACERDQVDDTASWTASATTDNKHDESMGGEGCTLSLWDFP